METADLKVRLHEIIDAEPDTKKLEAVYTLLNGSSKHLEPMSLDSYVEAIDIARNQIQSGEHLTFNGL